MSLDPQRKAQLKETQRLAPAAPGAKAQVSVNELKPVNDNGILGLFRKIFAK